MPPYKTSVNFHIYDLQTDIMKLLEAAQSRHLREVLKYKADGEEKFHNLLKEYNHFLQRQTFLPDTHRHVKHPNSVYLVNRNYYSSLKLFSQRSIFIEKKSCYSYFCILLYKGPSSIRRCEIE